MMAQSSGEWVPTVCLCGTLQSCCLRLVIPVFCRTVLRSVERLGLWLLVLAGLCGVVFLCETINLLWKSDLSVRPNLRLTHL